MQNLIGDQESIIVDEWGFTKMNANNYFKNTDGSLTLISYDAEKIHCVNIGKLSVMSQYTLDKNEQVTDVLRRLDLLMALIKKK